MISSPVVFLHTGQSLTIGEYLVRVLVHLLVLFAIGIAVISSVQAVRHLRSAIDVRGRFTDAEP